jgi:hypothetical protein
MARPDEPTAVGPVLQFPNGWTTDLTVAVIDRVTAGCSLSSYVRAAIDMAEGRVTEGKPGGFIVRSGGPDRTSGPDVQRN